MMVIYNYPSRQGVTNPTTESELDFVNSMTELNTDHIQSPLDDESMSSEIYDKIELVHNSKSTVGHSGINRTIKRLKRNHITFPSMKGNVTRFIRQCPFCQK